MKTFESVKIVENRKIFFIISFITLLVSLCFALYNVSIGKGAFNFDVDFSGGSSLQYELGQDAEIEELIKLVHQTTGVTSPRIQKIIGTTQITIKMPTVDKETRDKLTADFKAKYPASAILAYSDVSSTISAEMQQKAIIAVVVACIAMLIYISFRFRDFKMGTSAIAGLLHDVLIVLGVYIVFRIPVNNSFIAAILTILGFSINSTIVVFDRIRENKKFIKKHELELLIDSSIYQTLGRSINTSLTVLMTITCVYVFGVTAIREFAFPIIIGIVSGTYTSIFFASSIWYSLCKSNSPKRTA